MGACGLSFTCETKCRHSAFRVKWQVWQLKTILFSITIQPEMKTIRNITLLLALTLLAFSCKEKETVKAQLQIPAAYDGAGFSTNAATQLAVRQQLAAITDEAKKGRVNGVKLTKTTLDNLFTIGSPSLKSVNTTYFAGKLEGSGGWLDELAKASGGTYTPSATVAGNGGTFGTGSGSYLFDENGLEMEQIIEKGQFGSVLYKHATDLVSAPLTPATADQLVAVFGANPKFPSSSDAVKHPDPDRQMAVYAARRDKNDGTGFYTQMKNNFTKLQAALKAGNDYQAEQKEAVEAIKLTWEKVNAATIINYCHAVIATMSKTAPTDNEKAAALHAYGESVGFTHGWRTIPQAHKKITDAQIDETLVLLNAPANGTPTSYRFITDPVTELPKLQQVITKLKAIYGFTDQEITDFKTNWVSEQKR